VDFVGLTFPRLFRVFFLPSNQWVRQNRHFFIGLDGKLADGLKQSHTDARRKIEASNARAVHGDLQDALIFRVKELLRETTGLRTKNQAITRAKPEAEIRAVSMGGEKNPPARSKGPAKSFPARMNMKGNMRPIIKAGPLEMAIRQAKP